MILLRDYEAPSNPTDHAIRNAYFKLRNRLLKVDPSPVLPGDRLLPATLKLLDDVVDPPASGPYLAELGDALQQWLDTEPVKSWLEVVILPPCDGGNIIESWARAGGHQVLAPPPRDALLRGEPSLELDLTGDGLLVIPRLENWFLRHRNGLFAVRSLLAQLALLERRCLIGSNSWAWMFLQQAAGADVLLPEPQTFPAYDAQRLHRWFSEMAANGDGRQITFRSARSGDDVLAVDSEGKPRHRLINQLASRSLGIPWVAWHLWRTSLRAPSDAEEVSQRAQDTTSDDARTLWVVDVDDDKLPEGHKDRALLVLQALLIHHALTPQELRSVLPETGEADMMPALLRAGFVERQGELLTVGAAAYPAVRRALLADGCPVGPM